MLNVYSHLKTNTSLRLAIDHDSFFGEVEREDEMNNREKGAGGRK